MIVRGRAERFNCFLLKNLVEACGAIVIRFAVEREGLSTSPALLIWSVGSSWAAPLSFPSYSAIPAGLCDL